MPEYTTCVQPSDYQPPLLPPEGSFVGDLLAFLASIPLLKEYCHYGLHGKLVCLGGDQCAIGHITNFETVQDQKFPDTIDNDYCFNILLAPWDLEFFIHRSDQESYDLVANDTAPASQGELIKQQPDMPTPFQPWPDTSPPPLHASTPPNDPHFSGKFYTYPNSEYISFNPPPIPGTPYNVPILHCEIEGERLHTVCDALSALTSPGPLQSFCDANWFFSVICDIVSWFMTPFLIAPLITAWFAGSNDNRDFDSADTLKAGDVIVVTGRWVYDAGHSGWNELHPVKSVQKIATDDWNRMMNDLAWKDVHGTLCKQATDTPPPPPPRLKDLTPEQQIIYDNQRRPENRWIYHPLIDGCQPQEPIR